MSNLEKIIKKLKEVKKRKPRKERFTWSEKDIVITKKPDQKEKDASN